MKEADSVDPASEIQMLGGDNDNGAAGASWNEIPRRALMAGHGTVLSDEALLRLFAEATGVAQHDCQKMAEAFLVRFGSLAAVFAAEDRSLIGLAQVGPTTRVAIRLAQEAAIRVSRARLGRDDIFSNRKLLLDYLMARLAREAIEQFRILFLDAHNRLLADEAQTKGTVNHTPVYPREVARQAMELGARGLVLVHNHPSGDPTPSEADIAMTHNIQKATSLIEVRIADHIIIGNGAHVSLRDLGLLSAL